MNNYMVSLILFNLSVFCANMALLSRFKETFGSLNPQLKIVFIIPVINIISFIAIGILYFKTVRKHVFTYGCGDKRYACYGYTRDTGIINDLNTGKIVQVLNFNALLKYLVSENFNEDEFILCLFKLLDTIDWDNRKLVLIWNKNRLEEGVIDE